MSGLHLRQASSPSVIGQIRLRLPIRNGERVHSIVTPVAVLLRDVRRCLLCHTQVSDQSEIQNPEWGDVKTR